MGYILIVMLNILHLLHQLDQPSHHVAKGDSLFKVKDCLLDACELIKKIKIKRLLTAASVINRMPRYTICLLLFFFARVWPQ